MQRFIDTWKWTEGEPGSELRHIDIVLFGKVIYEFTWEGD